MRVRDDGSIDAAFAAPTSALAGFAAAGVARDADRRYVLAGNLGTGPKAYRFGTDGAFDPPFGAGGSVDAGFPCLRDRAVRALALGADGRILVGGYRGTGPGTSAAVAALDANGDPDATWNDDGLAAIDDDDAHPTASANAIALDTEGDVVVSGTSARTPRAARMS